MGNFEKLGILVIIVLIVTILVLTFWGMNIPPAEIEPATELSKVVADDGAGSAKASARGDGPESKENEPAPWPPTPVTDTPVIHKPHVEPPVPPDPIDPVPEKTIHVVQKGDSFWGLAKEYYGNGKYYARIAEANPGITARDLIPGTKLVIPPPSKDAPDHATPPVDDGGEKTAVAGSYTVRKQDSLYRIAANVLGDGGRWQDIYEMNRDQIGSDPGDIHPGMTLRLPR